MFSLDVYRYGGFMLCVGDLRIWAEAGEYKDEVYPRGWFEVKYGNSILIDLGKTS